MSQHPQTYEGYDSILFARDGDILKVTIANPRNRVNAVDGLLHAELVRVFADLKSETAARAVVLTGAGRAFSAGGDFGWMRSVTPETLSALRKEGKQIVWNALDVEVPIVAAVNGPAIGLGATLALLCDVVVMAKSATIADPHVRVGLVAGDGGAVLWPLLIGPVLAKRFLLTGEPLSADAAARLGLISEAVPDQDLLGRAEEIALDIAAAPPLAVQYTKLAVNQLLKQSMATAFDYSTALELLTFVSADHREALDSLECKRSPQFEGR